MNISISAIQILKLKFCYNFIITYLAIPLSIREKKVLNPSDSQFIVITGVWLLNLQTPSSTVTAGFTEDANAARRHASFSTTAWVISVRESHTKAGHMGAANSPTSQV